MVDVSVDTSKQINKPHHALKQKNANVDLKNMKSAGFYNSRKAKQAVAHQLNIEQLRLSQIPTKKLELDDPPLVVAVQGPPGCGKSLLIKCLIRYYSSQTVSNLQGPITVVTSKTQRITFIEIANDLKSMIDASKIADLVLLCVNAENGLEMETFEFLNLLLNHGFPKLIGVITHLDQVDRSTGKSIKARLQKELNTNIKIYKLEKIIHGRYEKKSIQSLARLLNVAKIRIFSFRNGRGYCLVDRVDMNDGKVLLYGYCRGSGLKTGARVHIPGVGDCVILEAKELDDPCPCLPPKSSTRTLIKAQRSIHAPFSTLGGLVLDEEGARVDIPINQINYMDVRNPQLGLDESVINEIEGQIEETEGIKMIKELSKKGEETEDDEIELYPGMKMVAKKEESKEMHSDAKILEKDDDYYEEEDHVNEEEEEIVENGINDVVDDYTDDDEVPDKPSEITEGAVPHGKYVRLEFEDIPESFFDFFSPTRPLIVGSLKENETEIGVNWIKIRRHRFYKRQLKSTDPFIVSAGWRRFQTIPVFFDEDRSSVRNRFLKYLSNEGLETHYCIFWGPKTDPNCGIVAFQVAYEKLVDFRVSATGVTISEMGDGTVKKKLRLQGEPKDISKNTCTVHNMFTSEEEATRFIGSKITTTSKIRGIIKKANKDGSVRCTFEDKLRSSDIVFISAWVPIQLEKFYKEINDLVMDKIHLVRTYAELRADNNIRPQYKEDSVYKKVDREIIEEGVLSVPKKLKQNLPYAVRKNLEKRNDVKASIHSDHDSKLYKTFRKMIELRDKSAKVHEAFSQKKQDEERKKKEKEQKEMMHKRTKNKQEFFRTHPKKARQQK